MTAKYLSIGNTIEQNLTDIKKQWGLRMAGNCYVCEMEKRRKIVCHIICWSINFRRDCWKEMKSFCSYLALQILGISDFIEINTHCNFSQVSISQVSVFLHFSKLVNLYNIHWTNLVIFLCCHKQVYFHLWFLKHNSGILVFLFSGTIWKYDIAISKETYLNNLN